jgi:hypothetical protein
VSPLVEERRLKANVVGDSDEVFVVVTDGVSSRAPSGERDDLQVTCFKTQDGGVLILTQSIGNDQTRNSAAHDHVVERRIVEGTSNFINHNSGWGGHANKT